MIETVEVLDWAPWCSTPFDPATRGNPDLKYVFGIDPASEQDNFALSHNRDSSRASPCSIYMDYEQERLSK